jgi:hypothetical protein
VIDAKGVRSLPLTTRRQIAKAAQQDPENRCDDYRKGTRIPVHAIADSCLRAQLWMNFWKDIQRLLAKKSNCADVRQGIPQKGSAQRASVEEAASQSRDQASSRELNAIP